jgi:hypothetical protein
MHRAILQKNVDPIGITVHYAALATLELRRTGTMIFVSSNVEMTGGQ